LPESFERGVGRDGAGSRSQHVSLQSSQALTVTSGPRQGAIIGLSIEQQMLIEQRVTNDGPSTVVAYLLWFFLFFVSGHRFYLGRPGSAILQILSYFILIGFLWALIDGFLIPGMLRQKRDELRQSLMVQAGRKPHLA
jgi:TM2 domain-containing membrane protein YozV